VHSGLSGTIDEQIGNDAKSRNAERGQEESCALRGGQIVEPAGRATRPPWKDDGRPRESPIIRETRWSPDFQCSDTTSLRPQRSSHPSALELGLLS